MIPNVSLSSLDAILDIGNLSRCFWPILVSSFLWAYFSSCLTTWYVFCVSLFEFKMSEEINRSVVRLIFWSVKTLWQHFLSQRYFSVCSCIGWKICWTKSQLDDFNSMAKWMWTWLNMLNLPYLPVYKLIPCISRPPILEPKKVVLISGWEFSWKTNLISLNFLSGTL